MAASLESRPETTAQAPKTLFEQNVRARLQVLLPDSPEWLQDFRLMALSRFEALGIPSRRHEAWKYINLRPLTDRVFAPEPAEPKVCPPALQIHLLGENDKAPEAQPVLRLVFVNGRFDGTRSSKIPASRTTDGDVIIDSLKNAITQHPELVKAHLGQFLAEEPDAFSALNAALFEDGAFVYLPDDAQFTPLLQLVFVSFGEEPHAAYPRNLFVLGKNAKVSLVVEHLGLSEAGSFHNSVNEFILAENAEANCTLILGEGPQGWHLAATRNNLQAGASLSLSTITLSGQVNRHAIQSVLNGETAHLRLAGLDVLEKNTEMYHHTVTEHWAPNGVSHQVYKGILDDESKSEFDSLVFVAKNALGTDSQQLNKTLLLSENAHVWTRPQLQINADDVKCAHGAAVGQLDENQLFYLASRGLDRELSQALLTYGFAEEVINQIANPLVRRYLDARVLSNLHTSDDKFKQKLGAFPGTSKK